MARPGSLVQPGARGWGLGIVPHTWSKGEETPLRKRAFFCYLEAGDTISGWTVKPQTGRGKETSGKRQGNDRW